MFGSVELFLNLLWAAIGLSAFAFLGARIASMPQGRRRSRLIGAGSLALLCVIVLLFPIISVTDDLHSGNVSAEDETTIARTPVILTTAVALPARVALCETADVVRVAFRSVLLDASGNPRSPPPFVAA